MRPHEATPPCSAQGRKPAPRGSARVTLIACLLAVAGSALGFLALIFPGAFSGSAPETAPSERGAIEPAAAERPVGQRPVGERPVAEGAAARPQPALGDAGTPASGVAPAVASSAPPPRTTPGRPEPEPVPESGSGARRPAALTTDAEPAAVEPAEAESVARAALRFVGKDKAAEAIWLRAINDPGLSAGVRSDLIEDLNDEGYSNPDRATQADLPLILERLALIERLAPFAMDDVNRAAFEEAYMDLLAMLIRLRGEKKTTRT